MCGGGGERESLCCRERLVCLGELGCQGNEESRWAVGWGTPFLALFTLSLSLVSLSHSLCLSKQGGAGESGVAGPKVEAVLEKTNQDCFYFL